MDPVVLLHPDFLQHLVIPVAQLLQQVLGLQVDQLVLEYLGFHLAQVDQPALVSRYLEIQASHRVPLAPEGLVDQLGLEFL